MESQRRALDYGVEPEAGSVVYREAGDGTINVQLVPKSAAQVLPAVAWGMACILVPVMAAWGFWLRGRVAGYFLLAAGFVALHFVVAIPLIAWYTGRQRLYIAAGPRGLSIWMTQYGDEVRYDWERQAVEEICTVRNDEGETSYAFQVRLRGRLEPVIVPVYRNAAAVDEIVRRVRRAIGLADAADR